MTNVPAGKATIETGVYDKTAKGVKAIRKRFRKLQGDIRRYSQQAALATATIGAPLVLAAKQFADVGDSLNKASIRTRIQVAELAKLRFAAEQSGVSARGLEDAIFRMDRRIGNAATGMGPAVRALKHLKIEAKNLADATPDKKLEILMDALAGVREESVRNQLGFELFGDNFRELVPLLDAGSGSLARLKKEAEDTGVAFTGIDATQQAEDAAKLADSFTVLKKQLTAIAVEAGGALAPALTDVAREFVPILKSSLEFIKNNKQTVIEIGKLTAVIGTLTIAMRALSLVNPWSATIAGIILAIKNLDKFKATVDYLVAKASGLENEGKQDAPNLRALVTSDEFKNMKRRSTEVSAAFGTGDPKKMAEAMIDSIDKAQRKQQQESASKTFRSEAKRLNELIKSAAKSVTQIAKDVPLIAGNALGVAGSFFQTQAIQPALATVAGGLGASGALGLGATKGGTSPIEDVSMHTEAMLEGVNEIKSLVNNIFGNGLDVSVVNAQEIKNG